MDVRISRRAGRSTHGTTRPRPYRRPRAPGDATRAACYNADSGRTQIAAAQIACTSLVSFLLLLTYGFTVRAAIRGWARTSGCPADDVARKGRERACAPGGVDGL